MSAAQAINRGSGDEALKLLLECCGSRRWADRMVVLRPFSTDDELFAAARTEWWALDEDDWLEAFASHPRIGDRVPEAATMSAAWSRQEQSGVRDARLATLHALARCNQEYEGRFGHVFLICATDRSASEMLEALETRLGNDPKTELRIAAGEQERITRLRLEKVGAE